MTTLLCHNFLFVTFSVLMVHQQLQPSYLLYSLYLLRKRLVRFIHTC